MITQRLSLSLFQVMAEMQKAGVDISPENAMSVFMGGGGNANSSKK